MADAPRIDTLRKQLAAASQLLDASTGVVETLHSLAYDRRGSTDDELAVTRTRPEGYDLLHGDRRARAAYRQLAREVFAACGQIAGAVRSAQKLLDAGERGDNRRAPQSITASEHLEALEAQARRAARGEFDPGRAVAQPTRGATDKSAARKIRALETELKKVKREHQRELDNLESKLRRRDRSIELRDARIAQLEAGQPAGV